MNHDALPKALRKPLALLALLAACAPPAAWAWGAGGHMMVAHIAEQRLTPRARQEAEKLLAVALPPPAAREQTRDFVGASVWADEVKREPAYAFSAPLHFIDYPFSPDRTPLPDLPLQTNIVQALEDYTAALKSGAGDAERAKALRFVIHFVGDIHQPLHCASRVTKNKPGGDKGGNDFEIIDQSQSARGRKVKLHAYWDSGIETFPKTGANAAPPPPEQVAQAAARAVAANPDSDAGWKAGGPFAFTAWSNESAALAQSASYKGVAENRAPSQAYRVKSIRLANRQVAWAGYRLAALLNEIWP